MHTRRIAYPLGATVFAIAFAASAPAQVAALPNLTKKLRAEENPTVRIRILKAIANLTAATAKEKAAITTALARGLTDGSTKVATYAIGLMPRAQDRSVALVRLRSASRVLVNRLRENTARSDRLTKAMGKKSKVAKGGMLSMMGESMRLLDRRIELLDLHRSLVDAVGRISDNRSIPILSQLIKVQGHREASISGVRAWIRFGTQAAGREIAKELMRTEKRIQQAEADMRKSKQTRKAAERARQNLIGIRAIATAYDAALREFATKHPVGSPPPPPASFSSWRAWLARVNKSLPARVEK